MGCGFSISTPPWPIYASRTNRGVHMPKKRGRKQIGDFIENGNIVRQGLEDLEKDEKWLIELLKKQTTAEPKEFFCADRVLSLIPI